MRYLTIICDIKNSRLIEDRESVQYKLIQILKDANKLFASALAVPFIITIGDEWQGLLNYPCDYDVVINFFHEKLEEINFYCGMGIGEVSIHNFELTVNQLDGPSFYLARDAIKLAKQHNYNLVIIQ